MILQLAAATLALATARAIAVPPVAHPTWAVLDLPITLDPGQDQQYNTLRLYDDAGKEIAYALDPQCAQQPVRATTLSDTGFVSGRYTETIADAGQTGDVYDTISIDTPSKQFFLRADVATSDDRRTWRQVRNGALIYRVAESSDPGSQAMAIPPARARWIRIRIHQTGSPFPIDGVTVVPRDRSVAPAVRTIAHAVTWQRGPTTSAATFEMPSANAHVTSLDFQTATAEFSRDVSVSGSDDMLTWTYVTNGTISRFAHGTPVLSLPIDSAWRYLRVVLDDGNDAPLSSLRLTAKGPIRRIVFIARPERSYVLETVPGAIGPQYDLPQLLTHDQPARLLRASIVPGATLIYHRAGPMRTVPNGLVTGAFAFAIATLGGLTFLLLRSPQKHSAKSE